jgi:hypothetical protein
MKIYCFDSWKKFVLPMINHWRSIDHEVKTGIYWGKELTDWADVAFFHPVDNNLIKASQTEKPKNTFVIAEAIDVDIYANHPGRVDWSYVDALVFMAKHMRSYAEAKFTFPDSLPRYTIPGGVNLNHFTLRQKPKGYNIAWIGRLWIAKNVFGALQIFHHLIKIDDTNPWRLFLRGDRYHPNWWQACVEWYIATNPELEKRVEFVPHVTDINVWLEDIDFLLQTSFKEAFAYVVAEAAAKGIQPIIQNTTGVQNIWPNNWIFNTHEEACQMILRSYDPASIRAIVANLYPLTKRIQAFEQIIPGFNLT